MRKHARRLLLLTVGWLFVAIGMVGVFLPVLPTTPFLLVALWAFAQSSERFHAWLYHHRLFGPPLRDWERYRAIPARAKLIALTAMVLSMTYVIVFSQAPWYVIAGMGAVMAYGAWFILTKPSSGRKRGGNPDT